MANAFRLLSRRSNLCVQQSSGLLQLSLHFAWILTSMNVALLGSELLMVRHAVS